MPTPDAPTADEDARIEEHFRRSKPSRMAAAVGPCHTSESLRRVLGRSEDEFAELVEDRCLLALTTADGYVVFPAFQLHNDRLVPGLSPVLSALREGIDDPWAWALWLNSIPPVVDGIPPQSSRIQQLVDGKFDTVLRAAERAAWSWRS